jgi:hypothetical protein
MSKAIRTHGNNRCQICGREFPNGEGLFACHLFELKAVPECVQNRVTSFNDLDLGTVNDPRNYLCLCQKCHDFLDDYNITIDPKNHNLLISTRIFREEIFGVDGISCYQELVEDGNGQPTGRKLTHVDGNAYKHLFKLLQYRKRLYDIEQQLNLLSKNRALNIGTGGKRKFSFQDDQDVKKLKSHALPVEKERVDNMKALLKKFGASTRGNKLELFERIKKLQKALREDFFEGTDFEGLQHLYENQCKEVLTVVDFYFVSLISFHSFNIL